MKKVFLIALAVLLWIPLSANAYSVSPATIELSGTRGEVVETSFTLINSSTAEQTLYLSTIKFVPRDESGTPEFISEDVDLSGFPEWVSFPSRVVSVPAHSTLEVPVTIAIPNDVRSGGHYGALVVSEAPSEVVENNGASLRARTAILVFLTVEGETIEEAQLLDFTSELADKQSSVLQGKFAYRIQNQGNVHITPQAQITLTDMFGRELAMLDANPSSGRVLPSSTRTFEVELGSGDEPNFLEAVNMQLHQFVLGPVRANLVVSYGDGKSLNDSLSLWILPWQSLILLFGFILVAILFILVVRKKH